jgi:hypothetical protein
MLNVGDSCLNGVFEVLTAMSMSSIVFSDVAPCSLVKGYTRLGRTHKR